jgi:hypothetical protein
MSTLLPLLRQQLELQEKSLALQRQLVQAIETAEEDKLEDGFTIAAARYQQALNMNVRVESTASPKNDMDPSLDASEKREDTKITSAFTVYRRFLRFGDGLKCFTEQPEWEEITTESMSATRIREEKIATLETLMVFYTLMLTVAIEVLQGIGNNVVFTADLVLLCLSYGIAALSFVATTIVFCVLRMVLAVSDCNLKVWCKANSHVFLLLSTIHNLITISTALLLMFLFLRALPLNGFPISVQIGVRVGAVLFSLILVIVTGAALCAPARSAAHTCATSDLPICSDAISTQASPEDAMRILYDEAFEPDLHKLLALYRAGHGQEVKASASDEMHYRRRGFMVKRRAMQMV